MILALSVIIITKDAEKTIQSCLDSVKWADEIIIFDSGSQDSTLEYCRSYTQKIFLTDWPGFGVQKNRALNKAKGQWVLSIDADESLSDDLIEEIKQIIYHNPQERHDAFEIKRISFFAGKKVRYGDWRNDKVVRLFRRLPPIQFTSSMIHERLKGYRHLGRLKNPMLHKTMETMSHVLMKLEYYSSFGAQVAYQKRKKSTLFKAILHALWCFIRGYLLRLGFLDGREGFILAISNASGVFYRYIKLIYLYKTHHVR
ncbi:glycosyltransferase family 2 protein [Rickettsiella grylli]|uniref:Lipopolysaccharide core biosynthesis glycosyltransferase WaaE n=1 Tax=Rickettsiella grylli TaxID=59196 RepID=A8PNB1_9COXI|nr:glycosyltransferase family 2 protein [Rickettsiella grylli]EDP46024.1 lipopolysaccharide core biosynthesis glycosyltransferase WaaE [Rickettsiella grylli]